MREARENGESGAARRGAGPREVLTGAAIFDGHEILEGHALVLDAGRIAALVPEAEAPRDALRTALGGGTLAPGFVDLQVNGGGGRMLDAEADVETIRAICNAHRALGATSVLPTLITDAPGATARVVAAGIAAAQAGVAGFLGLHLEGPHLDPRRAGAHDPALIRPMEACDLALLTRAARALPALMVTLAPASASLAQIAALAAAGAVVSLGHAEATEAEARAALAAGASCVTHLFNAMSGMGHRAPGLAGTALATDAAAGLIADGVHVAPSVLKVALAARPAGLFLVSDAMAVAGTGLAEFHLGGRRVLRRDGRLVLEDGTLAGADLTLAEAVRRLVLDLGVPPARALGMATAVPAGVIGAGGRAGRLAPGRAADIVHLAADWTLAGVWAGGARLG